MASCPASAAADQGSTGHINDALTPSCMAPEGQVPSAFEGPAACQPSASELLLANEVSLNNMAEDPASPPSPAAITMPTVSFGRESDACFSEESVVFSPTACMQSASSTASLPSFVRTYMFERLKAAYRMLAWGYTRPVSSSNLAKLSMATSDPPLESEAFDAMPDLVLAPSAPEMHHVSRLASCSDAPEPGYVSRSASGRDAAAATATALSPPAPGVEPVNGPVQPIERVRSRGTDGPAAKPKHSGGSFVAAAAKIFGGAAGSVHVPVAHDGAFDADVCTSTSFESAGDVPASETAHDGVSDSSAFTTPLGSGVDVPAVEAARGGVSPATVGSVAGAAKPGLFRCVTAPRAGGGFVTFGGTAGVPLPEEPAPYITFDSSMPLPTLEPEGECPAHGSGTLPAPEPHSSATDAAARFAANGNCSFAAMQLSSPLDSFDALASAGGCFSLGGQLGGADGDEGEEGYIDDAWDTTMCPSMFMSGEGVAAAFAVLAAAPMSLDGPPPKALDASGNAEPDLETFYTTRSTDLRSESLARETSHAADALLEPQANGIIPSSVCTMLQKNVWDEPVRGSVNLDLTGLVVGEEVEVFKEEVLGQGAMGLVYRGTFRGTPAAIKTVPSDLLKEEMTNEDDSFWHEVNIMARLKHPNVVNLFGACIRQPQLFLVEELMSTSLASCIKKREMPMPRVFKLARDMFLGLEYLHSLNVVHRDLKPDNILMSEDGTAKIADFGLARAKYRTYLNMEAAGTVAYMAPECFDEDVKGVTSMADIYSMGMILWEMVTLNRPWEGKNHANIIFQIFLKNARPPLPEDPDSVPPKMRGLVEKCWQRDWHERPTASEALLLLTSAEQEYETLSAFKANAS